MAACQNKGVQLCGAEGGAGTNPQLCLRANGSMNEVQFFVPGDFIHLNTSGNNVFPCFCFLSYYKGLFTHFSALLTPGLSHSAQPQQQSPGVTHNLRSFVHLAASFPPMPNFHFPQPNTTKNSLFQNSSSYSVLTSAFQVHFINLIRTHML